jgi:hypothetical protein
MIHGRLSFHIEIFTLVPVMDDSLHLSGTFPTINSRVEDTRCQLCNELNISVDIKPIMRERTATMAARSHCNHHVRSTELNRVHRQSGSLWPIDGSKNVKRSIFR